MKCKFCPFETDSSRGLIRHLNIKIRKNKKQEGKRILLDFLIGLLTALIIYFWAIPFIDAPIIPEFDLDVKLQEANYFPNSTYTDKKIYWKEDYEPYEIEISNFNARVFDVYSVIVLNRSIFAYNIIEGSNKCVVQDPDRFTYSLSSNGPGKVGLMSNFNYSDPNIRIKWGRNYIYLECEDLGRYGYFRMIVYVSKTAQHSQNYNHTGACGVYEGVRKNPTPICANVNFTREI